jgi:hypothetical protein
MSNHPTPIKDAINRLVNATAGQGNIIAVNRFYVDLTGSLEAALLLAQIIFWSDRTKDKAGWFAKSYKEWHEEIALSEYQVRNAAKTLIEFGVETKLKKFNGSPTLHYRLKSDVLSDSILKILSIHPVETSETITESTTETTKEKDSTSGVADVPSAKTNGHEPTPKKARPPCKWEPLHDALLVAFGLEKSQMTPKADKIYWTVAHELYVVKMTPEQIPDFHAFMVSKAKANEWSDWTVSAMAKYAPDFLRDGHKKTEPEFARGIRWVGGE